MSQKIKRLAKKMANIGAVQMEKAQINAFIHDAEHKIEDAKKALEEIDKLEKDFIEYAGKVDNVEIYENKHKMIDGNELDLLILKADREVIVTALGLVGRAKAHPMDEFNFELGYELALHRLLDQYLYILCNNRED